MSSHEEFDTIAAAASVGAATNEEQRALHAHNQTCADCRTLSDDYVEAASFFARGLDPVEPPQDIRGDIVNEVTGNRSELRWWLATAATFFLALWLWREVGVRAAREHIASRDAEIETLKEQNRMLEQHNNKLNTEIAALASGDTRMISLAGQHVSPAASARVFLEPSKRRAIVLFTNLPDNPNDKSYQLWIIRADQAQPQSAGVFDVTPQGNASITIENLPVDTQIKAMAVTLEPKGGVAQPTNANYYLMGKS